MPDDLDSFFMNRPPTPERPLLGLTVLVVEDSRFACEAMRLLCLRSGARIRRADSLKSAHRHLSVYRPMVIIVDLGLPDGSGAGLIEEVASATPRVPVILGISGDSGAREQALAAGADGFLEKPVASLAAFQTEVLRHLPRARRPRRPRPLPEDSITPDTLALHEDFAHVSEILKSAEQDDQSAAYVAQFLAGLARISGDIPLELAAGDLQHRFSRGEPIVACVAHIAELLRSRLGEQKTALG